MFRYLLAIGVLVLMAGSADAGMPSMRFVLTEVAEMRLQTMSFFLAAYFASAFGIKLLWNCIASDFTVLPQLSYGRALALTTLWALLFVVVLTMISGARELMTPGAWEKDGVTLKVVRPRGLQ
jgi:hypothetical protein